MPIEASERIETETVPFEEKVESNKTRVRIEELEALGYTKKEAEDSLVEWLQNDYGHKVNEISIRLSARKLIERYYS